MKKGFITTLFAVITLACAVSAFAAAPTVSNLPDVTVGDQEDNISSDNNWFVFTNAFRFDDYASDDLTSAAALLWSFDELGDDSTTTLQRWYSVNGALAVHAGNSAIATADGTSYTAHISPAVGTELRASSAYASFRDIVFSPPPQLPPFATPTADHSVGRVVRFYVSDGTSVSSDTVIVNTVDNSYDSISGTAGFTLVQDDQFTTDIATPPGSSTGWSQLGLTTAVQSGYPSGLVAYDYDSANTALRGRVYSSLTATVADYRYRAAGWYCNQAEWLKHASVGSTNYVRAKFWMYAAPISTWSGTGWDIPNFRAGVASRFAVTQQLEGNMHDTTDAGNFNYGKELQPSTDATKPSLYRVDLAPYDVPYLQTNKHTEGYLRRFDAFALQPPDHGHICLAESAIGVYAKAALTPTEVLKQDYNSAALAPFVPAAEQSFLNYYYIMVPLPAEGSFPNSETAAGLVGTITNGGLTLDTSNVASDRIGILTRDFNPDSNTNNYASHPRVIENKQYRIRFHVTATTNVNRQASVWLRTRSIKFAWSYKLELAGAWATGGNDAAPGANNTIAQQIIPGAGSLNPDKRTPGENGGWYTVIMHTPMSTDIRPEFAAGTPLSTRMPLITALPGPGVAQDSRRDIRCGVTLVDSLDTGNIAMYPLEKGNMTIDQVEVYESNLVAD